MSKEQTGRQDAGGMADLTLRMQRNDEEAYREFHHLYFGRLLRYLLVISGGDEQRARDALQDTLLRVVKHIKRFDSEEAFWSWLTVLARSSICDQGRMAARYWNMLQRFFMNQSPPAAPAPEALLADLPGQLDAAVKRLPETEQCILKMKYFEGFSIKEIAKKTQLSEKAVESRLVRARKILKEILRQYERPHGS